MRLIKRTRIYLITLGLLVFAAGSAHAGGVIEEWVRRYNGPGNNYDGAIAVAIDSSDNIYVTGGSTGSGTGYDYATVKYDASGTQLWVARYNGAANGDDSASAIAVDGSGNIYVTGASYGTGTSKDYATVKYDTNGSQLWVAIYNGPINNYDAAWAIAVDSSDNVYVTGQSLGMGTNHDYVTIKYDKNGTQLWVARYNGPVSGYDYAIAIAVDGSGNAYVTGGSTGSGTSEDYATVKYDTNGTQLWVARYNGLGNGDDSACVIVADSSGHAYVTGESAGSGTAEDYATIEYDTNGNQLWVARYNGPGNDYDSASAITVDGSSNIYVTGVSTGSGTSYDYATIKYDTNGGQLWASRYNGPGNDYDGATAIVIDNTGNIFVTGRSIGSGTFSDYATIKYDSAGLEQKVCRYNGPGDGNDAAYAIAVDSSDYIYVTGKSFGSGTADDYATIKYNQYPPFILTMQTTPPEVDTVTPPVGYHEYAQGVTANISAQRFVNCPYVYVFDHWEGDVGNPGSADTTIVMDSNETVTAVFVDGRLCGDECHPYPEGDSNKDCEVDFGDFALFATHWLDCTKPECD